MFLGDSHVQGLAVSSITPNAVNLGIGGNTTVGLIQRLQNLKSLQLARTVVIAIGYN